MSIETNIAIILDNIAKAQVKSPNSSEAVTLVAVTKNRTLKEIKEVLTAKQWILGENRVQELLEKQPLLPSEANWHLIGHLQTNKVKYLVDKVCLIHSLESEALAREINSRMLAVGRVMDCLVQVNVADEESKFGLAVDEVLPFIQRVSQLPGLRIKGLMNIAPYFSDAEKVRPLFAQMYQLFQDIKALDLDGVEMAILSMGMSHDYQVAIEEGANMVRIGSDIFAV